MSDPNTNFMSWQPRKPQTKKEGEGYDSDDSTVYDPWNIACVNKGTPMIPYLRKAWYVDQAILTEEDRLVVIRFGDNRSPEKSGGQNTAETKQEVDAQDEVLRKIAPKVVNFAVIYTCNQNKVKDFNEMYELYDPLTIMFFFRNKHMMCDFGTGNNNKINWLLEDKQELIDIIETIYRGAKKGRGLVVSPKDYSTRYRY